ncbi:CpsD/CapB family tyrosine-protein kinase [Oceanobacillus profundus]|uniref:CpsD/CapB family tyrosine-protein kinase n=1 Tax=Oceanobacillus TaxID=182709 RepID=UPI00203ED63A|nr:CpsD/CapB family tyrosine-protein kinase [Oceanobacillus profundus]MBR3118223.1 CpsD/CapB family tyrosine-protein kinase [Oceanobacillus sp.]MCM3399470.1 CpsD/CapB family tyrosine-protein kinase [Oceanobacillus profundus]MDO6450509.1 CpsD/CapB family tyrosine-protein kinase [Oceanobacillus profundus]
MARKRQFKNNKMRHLITKISPRSPISEQYRTVRTNLQFASADEEIQTLLLTSAGPSEGKSMTTANLAVVYAQQGKKVLLIDADLRKPTIHYTFRLDNLKGLSNVLVGDIPLQEAVVPSAVQDLDLISCGPIPPNPSELLGSKRMQRMIAEARELYDVIIFDTPPVLAVTDAQILSAFVDGSILVVRSKSTETESAQKAVESLKAVNAKILGTVLNDRDKKESNHYYYYGS